MCFKNLNYKIYEKELKNIVILHINILFCSNHGLRYNGLETTWSAGDEFFNNHLHGGRTAPPVQIKNIRRGTLK